MDPNPVAKATPRPWNIVISEHLEVPDIRNLYILKYRREYGDAWHDKASCEAVYAALLEQLGYSPETSPETFNLYSTAERYQKFRQDVTYLVQEHRADGVPAQIAVELFLQHGLDVVCPKYLYKLGSFTADLDLLSRGCKGASRSWDNVYVSDKLSASDASETDTALEVEYVAAAPNRSAAESIGLSPRSVPSSSRIASRRDAATLTKPSNSVLDKVLGLLTQISTRGHNNAPSAEEAGPTPESSCRNVEGVSPNHQEPRFEGASTETDLTIVPAGPSGTHSTGNRGKQRHCSPLHSAISLSEDSLVQAEEQEAADETSQVEDLEDLNLQLQAKEALMHSIAIKRKLWARQRAMVKRVKA